MGVVMAANALVQTRVDGAVKSEASAVLAKVGLTISDAVRLMLIKVAREKTLPFNAWEPNAETRGERPCSKQTRFFARAAHVLKLQTPCLMTLGV